MENPQPPEPQPPDHRREYLEMCANYDRQGMEASGRFDNWIMTLSAGALGLSLAFLREISPDPMISINALMLAWSAFVAALISGLLSQMTSQRSIAQYRKALDDAYEAGIPAEINANFMSKLTVRLNWAAFTFFISGVACLICFCKNNFS